MEYVLLAVLLLCSIIIVVAVTLQKSNEGGLSGTIAGGSETYYGKEKSAKKGQLLFKITLWACIIFAIAVTAVYVLQPDYTDIQNDWTAISEFSTIFD